MAVRWPIQSIGRRDQRARIVERWSHEFLLSLVAWTRMKEPIFQPGAGWIVLAMVLTIAFSWLFTYFVSAPIAESGWRDGTAARSDVAGTSVSGRRMSSRFGHAHPQLPQLRHDVPAIWGIMVRVGPARAGEFGERPSTLWEWLKRLQNRCHKRLGHCRLQQKPLRHFTRNRPRDDRLVKLGAGPRLARFLTRDLARNSSSDDVSRIEDLSSW